MPMSEAKIRLIQPQDNPAMAEVIRQVMPQFGACGPGYSIEDAEVDHMFEAYQGPRAAYGVIEVDGLVQGGAGIAKLDGGDKDTCELKKMYFLESLRGKGYGQKLMELCLEKAKELGFKRMYLETLEHMTAARKLYEGYGFKKLDGNMGNTGHSKCDAYYVKDL